MNDLTPVDRDQKIARHVEIDQGRDRSLLTIDLILLPGYSLLAATALLEPLRLANEVAGARKFAMRLRSWDGVTPVCANGRSISVDSRFDADDVADITLVCAGEYSRDRFPRILGNKLRQLWRHGKTVGGLDGGVFALAEAGILTGKKFVVHWQLLPVFSSHWPMLTPDGDIYCIDDRILSCAGGFAAADLGMQIVNDHCGRKIGQQIMDRCLLKTKRAAHEPQTSCIGPRVGTRNRKLIKAIDWIEKGYLDEDCFDKCAEQAGLSVRQLQRLFQTYVGRSPIQYVIDLRIEHSRKLLSETNLSIREIAETCGYRNPAVFSRAFRKRFGVSASRYSHFSLP